MQPTRTVESPEDEPSNARQTFSRFPMSFGWNRAFQVPGAVALEVLGETNEDGLDILRIQRVLNAQGDVLYDIETGHPDRAVEDRIDHVGSEYLDQLLEITYGQYFGEHVLSA